MIEIIMMKLEKIVKQRFTVSMFWRFILWEIVVVVVVVVGLLLCFLLHRKIEKIEKAPLQKTLNTLWEKQIETVIKQVE